MRRQGFSRGRRSVPNISHRVEVDSRSGAARRSREGFPVFVNFVSKRIHWRSLKEAFSAYGKVLGVYIAYNNPKRLDKSPEKQPSMDKSGLFRNKPAMACKVLKTISKGRTFKDALLHNLPKPSKLGLSTSLNLMFSFVALLHPTLSQNDQANLVYGSIGPNLMEDKDIVGLVDIPNAQTVDLVKAAESYNSLSRASEPTPPTFDNKTCLFKIKPRCLKSGKSLSPRSLREKLDSLSLWSAWNKNVGILNSNKKTDIQGVRGIDSHGHVKSSVANNAILKNSDVFTSNHLQEARLTVEVCKCKPLGFSFEASDSEVCKKLVANEEDLA
ncbi:hypothetical protein V6N11_083083 [Hibiscus sabdariffa]|uniref:RRM domain-containing protein n=1 Tax=Hibiscus sabdariffa TaxID=183260 RepID=A0ABR2QLC4_9ROSI